MRPVRRASEWVTDGGRRARRHRVCGTCERWLSSLVKDALGTSQVRVAQLYGAPSSGPRALMFDDQCHLCHGISGASGSLLTVVPLANGLEPWPPMFLCPSCEGWLSALAEDGRSARGTEDRVIDGPYGEWPHPNLRELRVHLAVRDGGAREAILESCVAMDVKVVAKPDVETVVFVEAGGRGEAEARLRDELPRRGRVLLAPLSARKDLGAALALGATAWLTIPVTPQQVTAALSFALRQSAPTLNWDDETCLPIAQLEGAGRAALLCEPAEGCDRFELAWLLKRFSRGYDEVAVAHGQIVILPRARPKQLDGVIARLERQLGGRCRLFVYEPDAAPRRLDATG